MTTKVQGEIEEVKLFVAPNDTTKDQGQHHKFKINDEWYFVEFSKQSPTKTTFELSDGATCEFEGTYIEGKAVDIEGIRGQEHTMLHIEDIVETGEIVDGGLIINENGDPKND